MNNKIKNLDEFIKKVDDMKKQEKMDLSSDQDLSIAIMNLISIEEHFFFTGAKLNKTEYYDMIKDVREIRKELLKKIIKEIGWPVISKVGKEASQAAWLVAQHADHDVKFQEYCLNLMKNASDGDVLKKQIAYLTDRILVNTGKKQLYGTQFYLNKKGVYGPRPIKDLEI